MENIGNIKEKEVVEDSLIVSKGNLYVFLSFIASLCGVDLEVETNYFKEQVEKLVNENNIKQERIDELIKDKEDIKKVNEKLYAKKHNQKHEINEFSKIIAEFKEQNSKLKKENEQLKQEREKIITKIKELENIINILEEENKKLKRENEILNILVDNSRKIDEAKDGIISSDFIIESDLDKKSEILENNVEVLLKENEKLKEKNDNFEVIISDFDKVIRYTENINVLTRENQLLKEENNNLDKLMNDFRMIDGLETGIFQNNK